MDDAEIIALQVAEIELLEASYGEQLIVETKNELKSMKIANECGELGLVKPRGLIFQLRLDLFTL